jgi:HEPN domain-containing protein
MNRSAFQKLAQTRLVDARALLKANRFDAAYYMAGYSVECALKACIARKTRRFDFPPKDARDFYMHDLEGLVKAADVEKSFRRERQNDGILDRYWEIVKDWKPDSRYDFRGRQASGIAKALLVAIEDKQHGVLQCLFKYW